MANDITVSLGMDPSAFLRGLKTLQSEAQKTAAKVSAISAQSGTALPNINPAALNGIFQAPDVSKLKAGSKEIQAWTTNLARAAAEMTTLQGAYHRLGGGSISGNKGKRLEASLSSPFRANVSQFGAESLGDLWDADSFKHQYNSYLKQYWNQMRRSSLEELPNLLSGGGLGADGASIFGELQAAVAQETAETKKSTANKKAANTATQANIKATQDETAETRKSAQRKKRANDNSGGGKKPPPPSPLDGEPGDPDGGGSSNQRASKKVKKNERDAATEKAIIDDADLQKRNAVAQSSLNLSNLIEENLAKARLLADEEYRNQTVRRSLLARQDAVNTQNQVLDSNEARLLTLAEAVLNRKTQMQAQRAKNLVDSNMLESPEFSQAQAIVDSDASLNARERKAASDEQSLNSVRNADIAQQEEINRIRNAVLRLSMTGNVEELAVWQERLRQTQFWISSQKAQKNRSDRINADSTVLRDPAQADQRAALDLENRNNQQEFAVNRTELSLESERSAAIARRHRIAELKRRIQATSSDNTSGEIQGLRAELGALRAEEYQNQRRIRSELSQLVRDDPEQFASRTAGDANSRLEDRYRQNAMQNAMLMSEEGQELTVAERRLHLQKQNLQIRSLLNDKELQAEYVENLQLRARQRIFETEARQIATRNLKAQGIREPIGGGFWSSSETGISGSGGWRAMRENPGAFFGSGLATTLKYSVGASALFGSFAAISTAVKDSEDLAISFSKLEAQLNEIDSSGQAFVHMREHVLGLSKDTGILADEIANMAIRIEGAFGRMDFRENDPTGSFGGLRGSDGTIRYGQDAVDAQLEAAAKLAVVTGISQKELTDGLTAASLAFGASADYIGDVAVRLETSTGTASSELIAFLGDIGPSAREAGFSLEEFGAIGATILKQSGMSGGTLAEQMGRIISSITTNSGDFFEMANANMSEFGDSYDDLISAIQGRQVDQVFMILAQHFNDLDKSARSFLVNLLGGERQANTLLAAFSDPTGLANATKDAEDSAGALEARFERLQDKISVIFSRLRTQFNAMVKAIIDSGLGEAVADIASNFVTIFSVVTNIVGAFGTVDQAMGGWLSKATSLAIQFALIRTALWAVTAGRGAGGRLGGARDATLGMAQSAYNGTFGAVGASARDARRDYLRSRGRERLRPGGFTEYTGASRAMAGVRGLGAGLMTAVGGPVGAGMLTVGLLTAGYSTLKGKVEKDTEEVRQAMNEAIASDKSAEDLRKEAERANGTKSWYAKLLGGDSVSTERDALNTAARIKDLADFRERIDTIITAGVEGNVEMVNALYRGAAGDASHEAVIQKMYDAGLLWEDAELNGKTATDGLRSMAERFDLSIAEAFAELQRTGDEGFKEVSDILLTSSNVHTDLSGLINSDDASESVKSAAAAMLAELEKSAEGNVDLINAYQEATQFVTGFANMTLEDMVANLDAARYFYESGGISKEELVSAIRQGIEQQRGKSDLDAKDFQEIAKLEKEISDIESTYLRRLADRAQRLYQLEYGQGTGSQLQGVSVNLELLRDDNFTSKEQRDETAMAILEAQRALVDKLISESEDIAEINRLVNEGVPIPAEVRSALIMTGISESNDFREFSRAWNNVRNWIETSGTQALKDFALESGMDKVPEASVLIRQITDEFATTGSISAESLSQLNKLKLAMQSELSNASSQLSQNEKLALISSIKFIGNAIGMTADLAVWSIGRTKEALGGTDGALFGAAQRKAAKDMPKTTAPLFGAADVPKVVRGEREAADKQIESLLKDQKKDAEDLLSARLEITKALADDAGDIVGVAQASLQQAEAALSFARSQGASEGEIARLQAGVIQARKGVRDAMNEVRESQVNLLRTVMTGDDPIKQAEFDLAHKRLLESEARGIKAKAEAALARIEAERALASEMADLRQAQFDLRRAQLEAIDDEVGAAYNDAEAARQQLADAAARGAGQAEILRLQGNIISADKAVRDAIFQDKMDEYQYLLDTNQITKREYVEYLEGLKSTLDPASKQFKDLERTLYQLRNDIGADLQMNLPTDLRLPVAYEAKRLSQVGLNATGLAAGSVGYQDNRNMDIVITIGQNMTEDQIVTVLANALGTGRNAGTPKRY